MKHLIVGLRFEIFDTQNVQDTSNFRKFPVDFLQQLFQCIRCALYIIELHHGQLWYLYWYRPIPVFFDGIRISKVCHTSTNSVAYALAMFTIMMSFMHQLIMTAYCRVFPCIGTSTCECINFNKNTWYLKYW